MSRLILPPWLSPESLASRGDAVAVMAKSMERLQQADRSYFADLRGYETLVVGSDYGGEHKGATHEVIAVRIAGLADVVGAEAARAVFRRRFLRDGRRMAYKNLSDRRRRAALVPFLQLSGETPGVVFVVLIARTIRSVFQPADGLEVQELLPNWKASVIEKAMRVMHIVSLLLAGFSRRMQDVLWVTDEDAIVANENRHRTFVETFARISSHYLTHSLRHLRVASTSSDPGNRSLEDFVALPDLVAGTVADVYRAPISKIGSSDLIVPLPGAAPRKLRPIVRWLADDAKPTRTVVLVVDEVPGGSHRVRLLRLHANGDERW